MNTPQRFEVKPKKRNYLLSLIASSFILFIGLAGFVVGIPATATNVLCGLFLIAFGGVFMLISIKSMRRSTSMILDQNGLQQIMLVGLARIPWQDIESIGSTRVKAHKVIGIRLKKYDGYINNLSPELASFINKSLPFMRVAAVGTSFLDVPIAQQLLSAFEGREDPSETLKKLGEVGSLAESMILTRQTFGYDILIQWTELDRPASEFIKLLESYRSAFG